MIYKFTYYYNNKLMVHTCRTEKEANIFFDILMAIKCQSIRIDTFKK